jgi:hypothetical protein
MSAVAFEEHFGEPFEKTVDAILSVQRKDGAIPWYAGGRLDPWNHVEAAMALAILGELGAARDAFAWLADNQREDGSWFAAYGENRTVLEDHCDTNATAYVATGLDLYLTASGDIAFVRDLFSVVTRALDFVTAHVDAAGALAWSVGPGDARGGSLLAASASVVTSLRSGCALAELLGAPRPDWGDAGERIARRIRHAECAFIDKSEYAMDWYYPVLAGVLGASAAQERLIARQTHFLVPDFGVRCRSDGNWVTAAESAECALAHWRAGLPHVADTLLDLAQSLRDDDGAYLTGVVAPERAEYPRGERTTYSAAAVVLAADALAGGPSGQVFSRLS